MSRSKKTGSTQRVGSGNRHWSGKSKNTPTRKGKEVELKNPRDMWLPKFKELPEKCASCPFRDGNDKEFGEVMQRLANSVGAGIDNNVHVSRGLVRADVESRGDFMCHGTVYTKEMDKRPEADYRQCPGASAYFRAVGLRLVQTKRSE